LGTVNAAVDFGGRMPQPRLRIYEANLPSLPAKDLFFSWPSHALNNLGWSYVWAGRYNEALVAFRRLESLHANRGYPQIFDGFGWSYALMGKTEEARSAFRTALRLGPGYVSSRMGLLALQEEKKPGPKNAGRR
jgi:tetratricopeptide (TPR) repeat protein